MESFLENLEKTDEEGSERMIIFVIVMGIAIIALLGYLGYAINEAYLQGLEVGHSRGYKLGRKDERDDWIAKIEEYKSK